MPITHVIHARTPPIRNFLLAALAHVATSPAPLRNVLPILPIGVATLLFLLVRAALIRVIVGVIILPIGVATLLFLLVRAALIRVIVGVITGAVLIGHDEAVIAVAVVVDFLVLTAVVVTKLPVFRVSVGRFLCSLLLIGGSFLLLQLRAPRLHLPEFILLTFLAFLTIFLLFLLTLVGAVLVRVFVGVLIGGSFLLLLAASSSSSGLPREASRRSASAALATIAPACTCM
jgi:hypothetical protein